MPRRLVVLLVFPVLMCACGGGGGSSPAASAAASARASAAAPTATIPASPSPTPTIAGTVYTVKEGDSLSAIAAQNNTTIDAIVKANDLTDPDKLQVGQKLIIPSAGAGATAASAGASLPAAASKPPPP